MDYSEFNQWFASKKFRHFAANELTWYFSKVRGSVSNKAPKKELWENIVPTLRILDDLRDFFGKPVIISSTYRDLPYNRAIGSPDGSRHVKFNAVDFTVQGVSPAKVFAQLVKWRSEGKFIGGIGKYPSFTHLDTRNYNATW